MDSFEQKKQYLLTQIAGTSELNPDASPKGIIDELVLPLIHKINENRDMVTTSSCSGRVSVFLEGHKHASRPGAKGNGGRWLYIEHDPAKLQGLHDWCDKFSSSFNSDFGGVNSSARLILYKFEPVILHVKCRDFQSASLLYTNAMSCGFRESGIGSNYTVGIRTSMRLDLPIGVGHDDVTKNNNEELRCLVSKQYLESVLIPMTKDMFRKNMQKIQALENMVDNMNINMDISGGHTGEDSTKEETKEQRRERKRREGLEIQRRKKEQEEKDGDRDAVEESS